MKKSVISSIDSMPALLRSNDLIALGLFKSKSEAYLARVHGESPNYIQMKRKILYKKDDVLDFINKRICSGDSFKNYSEKSTSVSLIKNGGQK